MLYFNHTHTIRINFETYCGYSYPWGHKKTGYYVIERCLSIIIVTTNDYINKNEHKTKKTKSAIHSPKHAALPTPGAAR